MKRATRGRSSSSVRLPETAEGFPDVSTQEIKKETNPFTDPDWRMLGYAWSGFAVRILLVLATLFSAYQYLQAREEKRVERTLQLVALWEQPEYQQAQRALKRRLAELNERHAGLLGANASAEERAIFAERIGIEALKESGGAQPLSEFRDEFDRIVYFLNRLAACVDGDLCSRRVADDFFLDFAQSFWGYFSAHAEQERRRGTPSFAAPLESYVTAAR